jgi:hypothetical protein
MKSRKKKNYKRKTKRKYKGGADMCAICLEDLNEGDVYTHTSKKTTTDRNSQVCNKKFHTNCMRKWHSHTKGRNCPLCRLPTDDLKEPFRQIDSTAGLNISLVNSLDDFVIGNDYIFQYAKSSRNMWKYYVQGRIRVKLVEILDNSSDRRVGMKKMLHFKDINGNSIFHVSNFIQLNPYNDDNHDDSYETRIKLMNDLRANPDKGSFEVIYAIS